MNFRLFVSLLLGTLLLALTSGAQTLTIKGKVVDTTNSNNLPYASVMLMHAKDSVMETYTRARLDGSFELHPASAGDYLIMITFPSFADYIDVIRMEDKQTIDLGEIPMLSRENLLSEFVLYANRGAIKVKGDTIEYVADSFKVKDNASVEDLLKKLPGLQVNKNGEVTAQGEKVQKILVDGEEFFSDDPAVVTKNLQANAIDKVQVFDKKSEQAEFTGIDDGQKIKTINLELKEDKKKGFFGKIEAGGGTGEYFQNQGMINQFKGKRQLSAFGIIANTGKVGLGWQDRDKYGSSDGGTFEMDEDGGFIRNMSSSDDDMESWSGQYNGQGLPKAWTGGVHYADKWKRDTNHVSANYRFAQQDVNTAGNTVTQYVLPGSGLNKYENNDNFKTGLRHRADGMYERKIDSLSSIKLSASGNYALSRNRSFYRAVNLSSEIDTVDGIPDTVNSMNRTTVGQSGSIGQGAELVYRKKFMKKGRSLIVNLNESFKRTNTTDTTVSDIFSYIDTIPFNIPLNQYRENESNAFNLSTRINYTEPLSKVAFLELNYGLNINNSDIIRNTYRRIDTANNGTPQYLTTLDPNLSTNYAYDIMTNSGGANLRFIFKKINVSGGGSVSYANFKQTDRRTDTLPKFNLSYNRLNFFPRATLNYKFNQQTNFYFSYNGATRQPTIDQIQPVRNNIDPLNIASGNPNLKQEFRHTFTTRYNDYKVMTGRYIWANASFSMVQGQITMVDNIDANGIRSYNYQNIDGNYNGWGYIGYGKRIQKLNIDVGAYANAGINHSNTFVNGRKNVSDNNYYGFGPDVRYDKDEKFSVNYRLVFNYNDNRSTISTNTSNYWTQEHNLNAEVQLPLKFELGTEVEWFIRQKTAVFTTNNDVFRWNAYASKKFLKKGNLELRAYVFDILNQNKGFQRFAQGNLITENTYNTITQYGMLSLIWNFTKMSAGDKPAGADGGNVIELK